ncbi:hypothetical protein ACFO3D_18300 [Virgibacillus kekensis]|uniref:Uncharacterized protein n=1 Tax=Virgibacillus kekensis TaxID=202261 RepID=A0ABV9DRB1_9BACI
MQVNWERVKPVKSLSEREIEKMLQSFMPGKKIVSAQLLGGGLSNSNYKLYIESLTNPLFCGLGYLSYGNFIARNVT